MCALAAASHDVNEDDFLGVHHSVRGFRWRERLPEAARNTALAISQRYDLPDLLGRVLAAREVELEEVESFLDPTIRGLMPDPSVLRDMDVAASRLADAIVGRQKIAVFGDYDVDGACSSALLQLYLGLHDLGMSGLYPGSPERGLRPQPAGDRHARRRWRRTDRHRRLRHDEF